MVQSVPLWTWPPGVVLVELVNWGVIMDGAGQVRSKHVWRYLLIVHATSKAYSVWTVSMP